MRVRRALALALSCAVLGPVSRAGAEAGGYRVVHAFQQTDGAFPASTPLNVGGALYLATASGGDPTACPGGCGAIVTVDPASGAAHVVRAFKGGGEGATPGGALLLSGGLIYGATQRGGSFNCRATAVRGCGTIYTLHPANGHLKTVYSFQGDSDGALPLGGLTAFGSLLYGTTSAGGPGGWGTAYSYDPATRAETTVVAFQSYDGFTPQSGLLPVGTRLYGATAYGGPHSFGPYTGGTLFALTPATGRKKLTYAFRKHPDGSYPVATPVALGALLYGTTTNGGSSTRCVGGCGVVYAVDPATGAETVLHDFTGLDDGAAPVGGLFVMGGRLYGTTRGGGGGAGNGVVFSLDPITGAYQLKHTFQAGADGAQPQTALMAVGGLLYGATSRGGGAAACEGGCGTVFALAL